MEKQSPCLSGSSSTNAASASRTVRSNAVESRIPTRTSGYGDPTVEDFRNFRTSGRPARFLTFQDNAWVDFPWPVVEKLSAEFTAGKALFELSFGSTCYFFDFLRLVGMNMSTEAASSIAWIDDKGRCFFPRPVSAPKAGTASRRSVLFPGVEMLREDDIWYQTVEKMFVDGMRRAGSNAVVTRMYKCPYAGNSPGDWRLEAFRGVVNTMKDARREAGPTYGWFGASVKDIAALVEHGFRKANDGELGEEAHGHGVHLSPPNSPLGSSLIAQEHGVNNGEAHVVLCRVILGNLESVEAGSTQSHPSSDEFDSGVDDLDDPKWYVVWTTGVNTRIIPEYVVSFKTLSKAQERGREVSSARRPTCQSFSKVLEEIGENLPSSSVQTLEMLYNQHKAGKISKDIFIRRIKPIIGDKSLISTIKRILRSG